MKKFLSVILSLLICFSSMSIVALAESSMDIIVDEVEVQYGATEATVNIKIPNNPGIALLGFNVDYDTSAMTLESATLGDIFTGDLDCNISAVPFVFNVYTGSSNKTSSGTLVTLKFNLKDKCPIGKYTIELKNVEALNIDENPVEYEVKNGYVNVKAKEMTGLSFEDKTYTYDATEKSLVVNGVPSGATVSYTSNDTTENRAKNVGTYTIYATVTKEGYNTWSKSAVLKINPKNLTVSGITVENKTYDGTTNATVKGGSLSGKVAGDDVDAIFPTTGTFANANVGKNVVVSIDNIVLNGNNKDNYTLTQPTGLKANITKAPISVKADDITIIQGATIPALTYTITSGQLFGADEITGSLATAAIGSDLGTFNITKGTLAVPSNYDLTFTKGTLTVVDKTPQNITVSDITEKTYGDSPFVVTATPDSTSQLAEFTFESSNTDVAEIATDGTVTIKAAGETDITVKQAGNEEFATFTKTQKLIVNKKAITIASINGDEKTAVLEGVLAEDTDVTLDYNKLNIEVAEAASETTSNVTFTNFVLIGNDATNYTITTESVSSVISNENMVTVTITADKGTATGAAKYIKGSSVTVSITPNTGYSFRGWYVNDTSVSTAKTYTFTATNAKA